VAKESNKILRWWNLARPGGSADQMVRILYGTEKTIFPKIIVACWPSFSRRERLDQYVQSLTSDNEFLKIENEETDKNNFLKNVFFLEKFAEKIGASTFHCFAHEIYNLEKNLKVLRNYTLANCWPEWNTEAGRQIITTPSLAKDGVHYGAEHHRTFARLLLKEFKAKYPGCEKSSSKYSDQYDKLIIEAMGGKGDNHVEKEDKIIRNIAKTVTIDKM
jgi:hypothetical protein